jgi:hypothetical protein
MSEPLPTKTDEIDVVNPTPAKHETIKPRLDGPLVPNPHDILLVSHPDTMDGMAAAWVIYKLAKRDNIPCEFMNTKAEATWAPPAKDILGRNWVAICSDGIPAGTYGKGLLTFHRSSIPARVPLPYRQWKRTLPFGIDQMSTVGKSCGVHDPKRSLCRLVWDFFCADRAGFERPPRLITHIDDHVTAQWKYNDSKAIATCVATYPHDFKTYDALAQACEDRKRREAMVAAGQGIARYIDSIREK